MVVSLVRENGNHISYQVTIVSSMCVKFKGLTFVNLKQENFYSYVQRKQPKNGKIKQTRRKVKNVNAGNFSRLL